MDKEGGKTAICAQGKHGICLQSARVEGQQSVLKPTYAKQRASAAGPVPDAVEVRPELLASLNESRMQPQQPP